MPNIIGIIPARGGSKGLQRKNLQLIDGKPLIWFTLQMAKKSTLLEKIVVSTDDLVIADYVKSQNVEVVSRPQHLATDDSPVSSSVIYTVDFLESHYGYKADIIVVLSPATPLRTFNSIDKAINLILNSEYDSIFSATISFENQSRNYGKWEFNKDGKFECVYDRYSRKRRQDFYNKFYIQENSSIYIIKQDVLKKYQSLIGEAPGFTIMMTEESMIINTEDHLSRAEILYKRIFKPEFEGKT
ncbi:MAG: acylneuraminate cytidylyltransferase family protein [Cyanobacteriota bacterium]